MRYDLEVIPVPEIDNPLFDSPDDYPVDKNNFQPRLGFAYDLRARAGACCAVATARFYDKTHFELIGGIYTGTVFTHVVHPQLPAGSRPIRDHAPGSSRRIRSWSTVRSSLTPRAPRSTRSSRQGRPCRNTGATWDNPDRIMPYTDQFTVGYERQLGTDFSVSADYVRANSRDLLISAILNPQLRNSTTVAGSSARQGTAMIN